MTYTRLSLTRAPSVARITLRPPDGLIDAALLRDLAEACNAIAASDAVVLLIDSEAPDFATGWADDARSAILTAHPPLADAFAPLAGLAIPTLVALHGAVISAGLELALACDLRLAAADARFALPEVALGTLPLAGGSQRLTRLVGRSVATPMLLLGDELDAQAAYRAGLVSRVFPASDLAAEAEAIVAKIAAHGPLALRYAKEAV
ncbi:MAG TPA: enoyl-CoA hydratase/isomerase family protein, partial [Dehalococcoidia bacterium]|nr:enoyl-CoA hydratase/isomerase family protein [Dehalococcoidia bacterium]